jgi:ABC-type branched-subunit amino acid transport system substrate-binding protein
MSPPRALLLSAVFVSLFACPVDAQNEDIVIGMSAAFKGPSAGLGTELYRGAMAFFKEVNDQGGVNGRQIKILAYDDNYNPIPVIDNTVRLVEKDKVFLLFGYVGTPTTTRILPLLRKYENKDAYLFFPFTGANPLREPPYDRYVFNLRASYRQETAGLVDHFVKSGCKNIGVFYQIDAYGRTGWDGVRQALDDRDHMRIAAEATYRRGSKFEDSMAEQVKILRDGKVDAVICIGAYAACAGFVRDCRDAGWDVPIANVSFVGSEALLDKLSKTGKDYTRNLYNSQVVPSYHTADLPAVKEYRELMKKNDPKVPEDLRDEKYQPLEYSFVSLEGFLDAKLLVAILKKMGDQVDRKRIPEVVESIKDLDLGIGVPITFGPKRHQGSDKVYFTRVENGRFVSVPAGEEGK